MSTGRSGQDYSLYGGGARLTELLDEPNERHEHVVITAMAARAELSSQARSTRRSPRRWRCSRTRRRWRRFRGSEADVRAGRVYSLNEVRRELGLAHLRLTRRARRLEGLWSARVGDYRDPLHRRAQPSPCGRSAIARSPTGVSAADNRVLLETK